MYATCNLYLNSCLVPYCKLNIVQGHRMIRYDCLKPSRSSDDVCVCRLFPMTSRAFTLDEPVQLVAGKCCLGQAGFPDVRFWRLGARMVASHQTGPYICAFVEGAFVKCVRVERHTSLDHQLRECDLCASVILGLVFIKMLLNTCYSWFLLVARWPTKDQVTFLIELFVRRPILMFTV